MDPSIQCINCKHYIGAIVDESDAVDSGRPTCKAFPRGIPLEITSERFDHNEPHPEDGGTRFESAPGRPHIKAEDLLWFQVP